MVCPTVNRLSDLSLLFFYRSVVLITRFELVRYLYQRIFLLLHVAMATFLCCSLDHVFTVSFNLGGWCMASTHLLTLVKLSTAFCVRLRRLANFYSKDFSFGTLFISEAHCHGEHTKVRHVCQFHHISIFNFGLHTLSSVCIPTRQQAYKV